jgi:hypothetical protein
MMDETEMNDAANKSAQVAMNARLDSLATFRKAFGWGEADYAHAVTASLIGELTNYAAQITQNKSMAAGLLGGIYAMSLELLEQIPSEE